MTSAQTPGAVVRPSLRLWPGVAAVILQWIAWFIVPVVAPQAGMYGVIGGMVAGLAVLAWWVFFSRAPWIDRVGAIALMVVAVALTSRVVHESVANGMMGMMLPIFSVPVLSLALVVAAAAGRRLSSGPRRASMVAAILVACSSLTLMRTGGITGDGVSDLHWRWTETPEERLLARAGDELPAPAPAPAAFEPPPAPRPPDEVSPAPAPPAPAAQVATEEGGRAPVDGPTSHSGDSGRARPDAEWSGFRGPLRDGVVRGVWIDTDWSRQPPVELWRRPIGPGWSSFAVHGDFIYTQEQRGDDELVSCYRLSTGEPVWMHRDGVRFWESNGGAGPRATPTLSNGRVYSFGATGVVNALDAETGALVWSRDAAADTGRQAPDWGFASSPLVVDDLVIVAVAGQLAAYETASGQPRWFGPEGGGGYSSPHLVTIDRVPQIVLLRGSRTISVAPSDGTLLWDHMWQPGVSIVQPALAADGDLLLAPGDAMGGMGMRRINVTHGPGGWNVEERWTSRGLKPYFNDFVVHEGHAFGFDGSILASIDLADGTRTWKGGRYGHGQLVLLPEQDLLLVLSEDGELALVKATPDRHTELARVPGIEGKTWNHPVLVGDVLLVRNGEEMAAFRLALADR